MYGNNPFVIPFKLQTFYFLCVWDRKPCPKGPWPKKFENLATITTPF